MGEANRRKALGLGFKNTNIQLARQAQLYKQTKELRPDLGMALALLEYSQPLVIGCSIPTPINDIEWDISIAGVLSSYGKIGENLLPSLPLISEGYFFTIAWNRSDGLSVSDVIAKLHTHSLVVRIEPKYKYLAPTKKEWVLPLVPVNDALPDARLSNQEHRDRAHSQAETLDELQ